MTFGFKDKILTFRMLTHYNQVSRYTNKVYIVYIWVDKQVQFIDPNINDGNAAHP